jgi:hypothetical protein
VISVVDRHAERWIMIGAAAASGMIGGLMQSHWYAAAGQANSGGEAGESGADDVYRAWHQTIA